MYCRVERVERMRPRRSRPGRIARMGELVYEVVWQIIRNEDDRLISSHSFKRQAHRVAQAMNDRR